MKEHFINGDLFIDTEINSRKKKLFIMRLMKFFVRNEQEVRSQNSGKQEEKKIETLV